MNLTKKLNGILLIVLFGLLASCASNPALRINYELTPETNQYKNKKVSLAFKDGRTEKTILNQEALERLDNFNYTYEFAIASENNDSPVLGTFKLSELYKEAFTLRLKNLGVEVAPKNEAIPEIVLVLNEYKLTLDERNWTISLNLAANFYKNDRLFSKEKIVTSAERAGLMARKSVAEQITSEIFSEIVNKLDLKKLFEKGKF